MKKYLNKLQLKKIGFSKIGKNNKISNSLKTINFKGKLGSYNRIDEDVILTGKVNFENNIHLGRGCTLSGSKNGIYMKDFATLSNYVQVFTVSDDYKAVTLSAGTLNQNERKKYSKLYEGQVKIGKNCIIGPLSIILPNTIIEDFVTISPLSIIFGRLKKGLFYSSFTSKKYRKNITKIEKLYNKYLLKRK